MSRCSSCVGCAVQSSYNLADSISNANLNYSNSNTRPNPNSVNQCLVDQGPLACSYLPRIIADIREPATKEISTGKVSPACFDGNLYYTTDSSVQCIFYFVFLDKPQSVHAAGLRVFVLVLGSAMSYKPGVYHTQFRWILHIQTTTVVVLMSREKRD